MRPQWYLVRSDDTEQFLACAFEGKEAWSKQRSPLTQGIDGAFKTEPIEGEVIGPSGFQHEGANQIISDCLKPDFLFDQLRRFAAQYV